MSQQVVFLIGMPSSGKSTIGKILAHKLGAFFVDTDDEIVKAQEKTIAEIFEHKGEDHFRSLEKSTLHQLNLEEPIVVSTGGGMPCFFDNVEYMLANGIVIYLDVTPDELLKRINASPKNERPLLHADDQKQLYQKLFVTYQNRQVFYKKAHIIIQSDFNAENVLKHLNNWKTKKA